MTDEELRSIHTVPCLYTKSGERIAREAKFGKLAEQTKRALALAYEDVCVLEDWVCGQIWSTQPVNCMSRTVLVTEIIKVSKGSREFTMVYSGTTAIATEYDRLIFDPRIGVYRPEEDKP